jgi:8-oxo-dGTP pyrophosphatase MutT (NUDIX family)
MRSDGQVLLVRHRYGSGLYLPGGRVIPGETFPEALSRELREELNISEVRDLRLFGAYSNFSESKYDYITVFSAKIPDEIGGRGLEIRGFEWAEPTNPPNDTSPGTRRRLTEFAHSATPSSNW